MTIYSEFDPNADAVASLSPSEKAAAVLLAMGKPVAGKLLKFFEYEELQEIIKKAQNLRTIKPQELIELVNEFEDLFSEGAGLMDNAKAMEGILEEGLTPDEVDGLLGRRTQFESYETSVWDRLQDSDPDRVGRFLQNEHPQTAAYIVSMLPTGFAGRTLMKLPEQDPGRYHPARCRAQDRQPARGRDHRGTGQGTGHRDGGREGQYRIGQGRRNHERAVQAGCRIAAGRP